MPVAFDGTGYLIHTGGGILNALPLTILAMGTRSNSSGNQAWVTHSQSNGDRRVYVDHVGSSDTKRGQHRSPVQNSATQKTVAPHLHATIHRAISFEVTSATSRTIRFGDSLNPATNTVASGTPTDDIASHNQVIIGAQQYNSFAVDSFTKGTLAEVFFIQGVVSDEDFDAYIAGTLLGEDIAGYVDGLTLKDYESGGVYTSLEGRTFTAVGGVSATALEHPVTRPENVTINATVGNATAAGAQATITNGQVTVNCTVGSASAAGSTANIIVPQTIACATGNAAANGSSAGVSNKIMSDNMINNSGTRLSAESANWYWYAGGFSSSAATSSGTAVTDANARLSPDITYAAGDLIVRIGTGVYFESFA